MSYLGFHLAFNLPLLLVLFFLSGKGFWPGEMVLVMVGVLGIVVAFTSPWDNWAVAKGIWDFPPERVRFRIGRLPVEEYAFFVIQSVEVMLLSWIFLRWMAPPQSAPPPRWIGDPQVMRFRSGLIAPYQSFIKLLYAFTNSLFRFPAGTVLFVIFLLSQMEQAGCRGHNQLGRFRILLVLARDIYL
jgi:lycopene cyclase domain-containing protein